MGEGMGRGERGDERWERGEGEGAGKWEMRYGRGERRGGGERREGR